MAERRHLRLTLARRLAALALPLLSVAGPGAAAELGEPVARSHIGQPLVADIELTALADPAQPVQVRLARPDVYLGAGLRVPAVLRSLRLSVMVRDGRQFLHLTTIGDVDRDALHLFLELTEGGQSQLRQVTLWLTPDPTPAQPPLPPAPIVQAAPAAAARPLSPGASQVPGRPPVTAAPSAPPAPPAPSPVAIGAAPKPAEPVAASIPPASAAPMPARKPAQVTAARKPVPLTVGPAACAGEPDSTCRALDYKNSLLSARIVELEDKVRQLHQSVTGQADPAALPLGPGGKAPLPKAPPAAPARPATAGGAAAGAHPPGATGVAGGATPDGALAPGAPAQAQRASSAPAHAVPAPPPSLVASARARIQERKAKEAASSPPWLAIGLITVGLALLGAAAVLYLRKRKARKTAAVADEGDLDQGEAAADDAEEGADAVELPEAEAGRTSLWSALMGRLRRRKREPAPPQAEPVLEEVEGS